MPSLMKSLLNTLRPFLVAAGSLAAVATSLSAADAPRVVTAAEKSKHFDAVNRHLELGGTVYGYVDIDGDVERMAGMLRGFLESIAEASPEAAMLRQDVGAIAGDLGLTDIKAIGISSVATGTVFRNRAFFYTPGGRHGLLAGLGGPAAPFAQVQLAPADADIYFESETDVPAVYAALRQIVGRVGGDMLVQMLEEQLKVLGNDAGISVYDLIQRLKGRIAGVVQLDESKTITIPGEQPLVIPSVSLLLRFDGIAPGLEPLLGQLGGMLQRSEQDGRVLHTFGGELPFVGWQPVIAIEGEALYIVSSPDFFAKCLAKTDRLATTPAFTKSLAELGTQGNELAYVSPGLFAKIRRLPELNPDMDAEQKRVFDLAMRNLPATETPIMSIRVNLPDGVLYRSLRDTSLKQELVLVAVYNPVTVGMMAAMAIPAFNKTRASSQDALIDSNLRQLSAAADQYYLETGKDTATYDDLVGPEKYIREELESVAGENYREIEFQAGQPVFVTTPDGREFSVQP